MKDIGTVTLRNGLILHNVFYVPQFRFNLIAVNKLIYDLTCYVTFNNNGCLIQGIMIKKPWLLGKLRSGLYVLEDNNKVEYNNNITLKTDSIGCSAISET